MTMRPNSYTFEVLFPTRNGRSKKMKLRTTAKFATKKVTIEINEKHIKAAIAAKGQGDPRCCAGTLGLCAQTNKFPHHVEPEFIDWLYTRVAICYKVDRFGIPKRTIVYAMHNEMARMFDSPARLKQLLERVQKEGAVEVTLYPIVPGSHYATGKPTRKGGQLPHKDNKTRRYLGRGSEARRLHVLGEGILPK